MNDKRITEVAEDAVKIYFDYNVSAKEAIEKAKEELEYEKMEKMEKTY